MKLDTLLRVFRRQPRVKIFVVTAECCLCAWASNPRLVDGALLVDLGPSLRVPFDAPRLVHEPVASGTLRLDAGCHVTRRLRTHRRHLEGRWVPEHYESAALRL